MAPRCDVELLEQTLQWLGVGGRGDLLRLVDFSERQFEVGFDLAPLFGGEIGHGLTRFLNTLVDRQWIGKLAPSMMLDVLGIVDADDAAHLRKLERLFKKSMEEMAAQRDAGIADFRRALDPVRVTLRWQPFLSGAAPAYADYIVFSVFQWARIVSKTPVLEADDALAAWRERMLDLYGGLGRAIPARA